MINNKIRILEQ